RVFVLDGSAYPPKPPSFPTRRSSDLVLEDVYTAYRFPRAALLMAHARGVVCLAAHRHDVTVLTLSPAEVKRAVSANGAASKDQVDRKSTRLNSSHVSISYAVFCLKKK